MIWRIIYQESSYKIMERYTYNSAIRKIEYYLYNYYLIDYRIESLKSNNEDYDYKQTYYKWIKSKSSSVEDEAIRNIENERRILKMKKWKKLIEIVLEHYLKTDTLKYNYIKLKYFDRYSDSKIEEKLNIKESKNIKAEILRYIYLVAIKIKC